MRRLSLPVLVLIAVFLGFFGLTKHGFSLDEVSSIYFSQNWSVMLKSAWLYEGNMWLYYSLLHYWQRLGTGEWLVRSLSVFFGILTVPALYKLTRAFSGEQSARTASLLLVTNLLFVFYAQQARSYSLLLFLVTLSSLLFLNLLRNPSSVKYSVLYLLTASLAIYSHLLAALVILSHYISLLFIPRSIPWKRFIVVALGIFISLIPLLISPAFSGHQIDWMQKPQVILLPLTAVVLSGDLLVTGAIYGLVILWLLWKNKNIFQSPGRDKHKFIFLLLWAGFPVLSAFVFSDFVKPLYEPEHFIISLPALLILIALALESINNPKWLSGTLLAIVLIFSGLRLFAWYSGKENPHWVISNISPRDWRSLAGYIESQAQPTDAIMFYAYYSRFPFAYYFNAQKASVLEISSGAYPRGGGTVLPDPNLILLDSLSQTYDRVWLILSYYDSPGLDQNQLSQIERQLEKNYTLTTTVDFNQIEVKLFKAV